MEFRKKLFYVYQNWWGLEINPCSFRLDWNKTITTVMTVDFVTVVFAGEKVCLDDRSFYTNSMSPSCSLSELFIFWELKSKSLQTICICLSVMFKFNSGKTFHRQIPVVHRQSIPPICCFLYASRIKKSSHLLLMRSLLFKIDERCYPPSAEYQLFHPSLRCKHQMFRNR